MSKTTRKMKVVNDELKVPRQLGSIPPQERQRMIAEAAYYRAQSHAFQRNPEQDWFEAEAEINQLLK